MRTRVASVSAAVLLFALCSVQLRAGLISPVARGSINLRPYTSMALMGAAYWQNRVYFSGQSTSGGGPNTYCVDVSDPDSLQYLSSAGAGGKGYGLVAQNSKLYSAAWGSGLCVYDVSTDILSQLGQYRPPDGGAYWHLCVWNDRAYVADRIELRPRLGVFDVSNPSSPQRLAILDLSRPNGMNARGSYLYIADSPYLTIVNVSNDQAPIVISRTNIGGLVHWAFLRDDYVYVFNDSQLRVYDITDPAAPVQIGACATWGGFHDGIACMLGNYVFVPTSGGGVQAVCIADPTAPYTLGGPNLSGLELTCTGNGKYIYLGNLVGDYEGTVHAVQVFDSDPDITPPSTWSGFSMIDASWDNEYSADVLPSASNPAWSAAPGSSESLGSLSGGVLRVNDNSASDSLSWTRNWDATNYRGATVLVRAKCASCDLNGGAPSGLHNIIIEDGRFKEELTILPDRIRANRANVEWALNGTQWHSYRITTKGAALKVYVDENTTPAIEGVLSTTTNRARVTFGSDSNLSKQDIYFDSVQCFSNGVFGPAGRTNDQTPDISVSVSDWVRNDSVSGIEPATAQYYWSTDGGITWNPSGWDCRYEATVLPTASTPAWSVAEGSESYGNIVGDYLRVNDNSTAGNTKVKWSRNWGAIPSVGTTILTRARCLSTGGDTTYVNNIFIEDGVHSEMFKIMTDRVVASQSNMTYMLDGTQWHTYRVTTSGDQFALYVDENPTAVLSGIMGGTTSSNRVMFGSGASAGMQEIHFDYFYYTSQGDVAPGQSGGAGQPAVCTGAAGDYTATLTASAIPFNQDSETLNKLKFSIRDMAGNISYSPVYNVRINQSAGPHVVNVTSSKADGTYTSGATVNVTVEFSTPVIVTYPGGARPKLWLEVGSTDRQAVCTSLAGTPTTTLNFLYQAGNGDTTADLDYTNIDALVLDGATILDSVGAVADIRLPSPGSTGSLGANKNIAIDAVKPFVTNVTSDKADGVYKSGESIDVLVMFSEAVNVTGTPQLELETGSTDRRANYVSGSGTPVLVFRYVGVVGDESPDLDYKATTSLIQTAGSSIKDLPGNTAIWTLPAPAAAGSLGGNREIVLITGDGSIWSAKQQPIGSTVTLGDKVLYLKQAGFGYIEESDRTCGIRVEGTIEPSVDSLVCLRGVLRESPGGELYLDCDLVTGNGPGSADPFGANNRFLGTRLMDGLYVTAWGTVLADPVGNSFFISDGSDAGGVRVIFEGDSGVTAGEVVTVRGAAGLESGHRVIHRE